MLASPLTACGDTSTDTTEDTTKDTDKDTTKDTDKDTTKNGTEKSGEFVVTGEKHTYKNKDVLLLNVENQTNKDYDVTAVVHYFDAEGNEIKSQKQTFTGWAAGYQNYFLFQPNIAFDTFTYTLELKEFDGECHAKYIIATLSDVRETKSTLTELTQKGDYTTWPVISAQFRVENKSENRLIISGFYVVFDKNGDIYHIFKFNKDSISSQGESYSSVYLFYDLTTEKLVWPEELIGDVSGVYVITRVWQ